MSAEQKFRTLSLEELRALSPRQRAEYLGQLALRNLQEVARREQSATQTSSPKQFDDHKARERGAIAGIVAVAATWVPIYIAYIYLRRPLGDELASGISAVAGLVTTSLLFVVRDRYVSWELRRYCSKNGHVLRHEVSSDGRPYVICTRCYAVMVNERASGSAHPNP